MFMQKVTPTQCQLNVNCFRCIVDSWNKVGVFNYFLFDLTAMFEGGLVNYLLVEEGNSCKGRALAGVTGGGVEW